MVRHILDEIGGYDITLLKKMLFSDPQIICNGMIIIVYEDHTILATSDISQTAKKHLLQALQDFIQQTRGLGDNKEKDDDRSNFDCTSALFQQRTII